MDELLLRHVAHSPHVSVAPGAHLRTYVHLTALFTLASLNYTLQVVVGPDGAPREKPSSPQEARAFLASYANATSSTVSAVVVTNTVTGQSAEGVAIETIHYGPGLAEESVVDDCLQPAIPVDARKLRANLRVAASALSSSSSSSSSASAGGASADGSAKRRRSARLSGAGASAVPTVSVLVTAGAVMIEHPSIAPHITAIERGGAHGSASSSSSSGAATNSSSGSTANDDDDVVDSIYGLPWRLTQQLIARVSPGHPWATLS